ncbi:MAG TPA: UDP-N-acetylmuramate dehydrogenase [Bacteroidales bacterium]|nr:UDP-N-acetylmuramate dehydrogenase [Bacteroidales bacterium]
MVKVYKNFRLKKYNTFGIDVKAAYYAECETTDELQELYTLDKYADLPKYVLGGGSNVLFAGDYAGLILRPLMKGIQITAEDEDKVLLRVGAGEDWDEFVAWCVSEEYGGVENLSLIPGNVGTSPMQNIGAYGVEVKDVIHKVEVLNLNTLKPEVFTNEECRFGYRSSIFKHALKGSVIITHVHIELSKHPVLVTHYGSVAEELEKYTLKNIYAVRQAVMAIRKRKLPDPEVTGNAGSFFKNPVIENKLFESLVKEYPEIPNFPAEADQVKIPAAWLIDQIGWKGAKKGRAGVHPHQPLVLINLGGAAGKEVLALAEEIAGSVKERFGIELEMEVNIV